MVRKREEELDSQQRAAGDSGTPDNRPFQPEGTHLITGGLGGRVGQMTGGTPRRHQSGDGEFLFPQIVTDHEARRKLRSFLEERGHESEEA